MKPARLFGILGLLLVAHNAMADAHSPFNPFYSPEILGSITAASSFRLDESQRPSVSNAKGWKPGDDKWFDFAGDEAELTDKQRAFLYRHSVRGEEDFLATQRKNPVPLTKTQIEELADILLDRANFARGWGTRSEPERFAVDAKSKEGDLTIVLHTSLVTAFMKGEKMWVWLNDKSTARLQKWMQEAGLK